MTTESLVKIPAFCNDPKTIEINTLNIVNVYYKNNSFFLARLNKVIFNFFFNCFRLRHHQNSSNYTEQKVI